MTQQVKNEVDAKLLKERNAEVNEALTILGAGDKETLADVARRRMHQAMPATTK